MSWVRRHPDLAALAVLLAVGVTIRAAILFRAPAFFVGGDSQTYLVPAYELARDGNWDLGARRPPGYPLFLAGVIVVLGEDMRAVVLAQHLLGLATIAATYGLGRAVAGRAAGVLAGLGVALSGPLLVYEHYIMAEALFGALLTAAAWALVAARRSPGPWPALVGGSLLAAGWLVRPAALLLVPLIPLALLGARSWRRSVILTALAGLGFALVAAPWALFSAGHYGAVGSVGIGNTLMWRVTREEPALIQPRDSWPSREGDEWAAARRYAFGRATRKDLPDDIADGVQERFGVTEAVADRVLAATALDAIRARPLPYLQSTARLGLELFVGQEQELGGQGKEAGSERYPNPREKYQTWWNPRIRHIPQPPTPAESAEFERARALVSLFQPHRIGGPLLGLCLAGLVAGLGAPRYRGALFLAAAILASLLGAVALAGSFPRFRYPLDPLILTLAATGGLAALDLARAAQRRVQPIRARDAPDPAAV
jgi:hypothetical protein